MQNFKSKKEVFNYIRSGFKAGSKLVLIRGSTAKKPAKRFSDFDAEAYAGKPKKPYYEIALLRNNPILISVYFYKYKKGNVCNPPENVLVLYGEYNENIKPDFSKDKYTHKERIRREVQLAIDFLFKYLRTNNPQYLNSVQKRL